MKEENGLRIIFSQEVERMKVRSEPVVVDQNKMLYNRDTETGLACKI